MSKFLNELFCELGGCSTCDDFSTCVLLKYAFKCGFYAFLIVCADFIAYLFDKSFMKINYKKAWWSFIFWPAGAVIIGYIGGAVGLMNIETKLSCLINGVTWPVILARWIAGKFEKADVQPSDAT